MLFKAELLYHLYFLRTKDSFNLPPLQGEKQKANKVFHLNIWAELRCHEFSQAYAKGSPFPSFSSPPVHAFIDFPSEISASGTEMIYELKWKACS